MKYLQPILLLFVVSFYLFTACNKPSPFGGEFVEDSKLNIKLIDTIPMFTKTVIDDSVLVYSPNRVSSRCFCGIFADPVFGKSIASIYTNFAKEKDVELIGATLDSAILQLPYSADGVYGETNETFGFEVYRVTEDMDYKIKYYSGQSFEIGDKVGEISFVPSVGDSVTVNAPVDTVKLLPHMRINVTDLLTGYNSFDVNTFLDDSTFYERFKGLKIVPTTENSGMLSFELLSADAGVKVFYHSGEEAKEGFFPLKRLRMSTFEHDYTGSVVEEYLNSDAVSDSVMFLQGMSGVDGILEIKPDASLKNKIINKVELIVPVFNLPGDYTDIYPYSQQLILSYVTDTSYYVIKDVIVADKNNNIEYYFGGVADETDIPVTYSMNITNYFQRMLDGEVSNKLALTVYSSSSGFPKAGSAGRTVLSGVGNSTNGIKLKVIYSDY